MVEKNGEWAHWLTRVQEYSYPLDHIPEYATILVPNVDNVCTTFLMDTIAKQEKSVLLIGEQGTAKTVMVKAYATHYNPEKHLFKAFNFSSASTPMLFQVHISACVLLHVDVHVLCICVYAYVHVHAYTHALPSTHLCVYPHVHVRRYVHAYN